jgi:hypothetical protein
MATSWYVETLLRNRHKIREHIFTSGGSDSEDGCLSPSLTVDLEDEDYNNLLLVEKTLTELVENDRLSDSEFLIFKKMLEYKTLSEIVQETGFTRMWVSKFIEDVCDRIAFILGDIFTNEGYLNRLAEKNHLTDAQIDKARLYMNSNAKNLRIRKAAN